MTRQHFYLIAEAIADWCPPDRNSEVREHLAEHLADCLSATNPRFDRGRFVRVATSDLWAPGARRRAS